MSNPFISERSKEDVLGALIYALYHHVAKRNRNYNKSFFYEIFSDLYVEIFDEWPNHNEKEISKKLVPYFLDYLIIIREVAVDLTLGKPISPLDHVFDPGDENVFRCMRDIARSYLSDVNTQHAYGFGNQSENQLNIIVKEAFLRIEGHRFFYTPRDAIAYWSRTLNNMLYDAFKKQQTELEKSEKKIVYLNGENLKKYYDQESLNSDAIEIQLEDIERNNVEYYLHMNLRSKISALSLNDEFYVKVYLAKKKFKYDWDSIASTLLERNGNQLKKRCWESMNKLKSLQFSEKDFAIKNLKNYCKSMSEAGMTMDIVLTNLKYTHQKEEPKERLYNKWSETKNKVIHHAIDALIQRIKAYGQTFTPGQRGEVADALTTINDPNWAAWVLWELTMDYLKAIKSLDIQINWINDAKKEYDELTASITHV